MTSPTAVESRLIAAHSQIAFSPKVNACFQHSFFCQTSLPYRVLDTQRDWSRKSGNLTLQVQAGYAMSKGEMVPVPLPSGPKARLILIHLMTEAVLNQGREIDLRQNLTRFVKSMGVDTNGRNLQQMRDQVQRLASCTIRFVKKGNDHMEVVQGNLCDAFKVFDNRRASQRWCAHLTLSEPFYESLVKHAVPLDPRALGALRHSAACIDTYLWLAQRLWRIEKPTLIRWRTLHAQLGGGSVRWASWKQGWLGKSSSAGALPQVLQVYPAAKDAVEATEKGLLLRRADPPISRFTT